MFTGDVVTAYVCVHVSWCHLYFDCSCQKKKKNDVRSSACILLLEKHERQCSHIHAYYQVAISMTSVNICTGLSQRKKNCSRPVKKRPLCLDLACMTGFCLFASVKACLCTWSDPVDIFIIWFKKNVNLW